MDVSKIWGKCWLNQGADVHSNYLKEKAMERIMDANRVCIFCGTNNSDIWWKCCPKHTSERGPDVCCQVCVENIHSKEYLGTESIQVGYSSRDLADLVARLREAADPTSNYDDTPWWWDCPDRGGPAQLLREAANAIEEIRKHQRVVDREYPPPAVADEAVASGLESALRRLGNLYGPAGVAYASKALVQKDVKQ